MEKILERKFVQAVKAAGGLAPKLTCPGFAGMPDRLVMFPGGRVGFVEVKQRGKRPTPVQLARHGMLRRFGFLVYVLDDEGQIERILTNLNGG